LSIDAAGICLDCATVATSAFVIPVGLMVLAGAVIVAGFAVFKRMHALRPPAVVASCN
jgi:hypothetical protein